MKILKATVEVTATMPDNITEDRAMKTVQSLLNMINKSYSDCGCKVRISAMDEHTVTELQEEVNV